MTVKQISVFLENKAGRLVELTDILSEHKDFGILRLIVDNPDKTAEILESTEFVFSVAPVLAVAIPDEPGSLSAILHVLAENDINLEYTYAFITRKADCAYMILRVEDNEATAIALSNQGVKLVAQADLYSL